MNDLNVNLVYGNDESIVKAFGVIARLHKDVYKFHCPCTCYDPSILKEGGEVWVNWDTLKIKLDDENGYLMCHVNFSGMRVCPICGRQLPTNGRDILSNGFKMI